MANPDAIEVVASGGGGDGRSTHAVMPADVQDDDEVQSQQSAKLLLRKVATRARRSGLRVALGVIFFFGFSSLVLTARSASFSHAWHRSFGGSSANSGGASTNTNILRHTTRTVVPVLVHSELDQFDSNASAIEDTANKNTNTNLELRSIADTDTDTDTTTTTAAAATIRTVPESITTDQAKAPASPPKYALLRVIGNALPPRHDPARTLRNLRFILEHERLDDKDASAELAKHWVVNRILATELLDQIIALLREFSAEFTEIPFDLHTFAQQPYRVVTEDGGVDRVHFEATGDGVTQVQDEWTRVQQQNEIFDAKNRYALSVNAARNVMLDIGRRMGARWIFPWDQNCFLTNQAWRLIKTDLSYQDKLVAQATGSRNARQSPQLKYFVTPMDRLIQENDVVLSPEYKADPWAEPQIIFREDALERFDEQFRYGKRDKVALLVRLKIAGPWSEWGWSRWEKQRTSANLSSDIEGVTVPQTGYVVRLYSGVAGFEVNDKAAAFWRELKRGEAVVNVLNGLEKRVMKELFDFKPETLTVYSTTKIQQMQREYQEKGSKGTLHALVIDAMQTLRVDALWTVTSNEPLDKFKQRNVFSNYFDKSESGDDAQLIKHMVYNTTALTLVWQITGEPRFAEKAVEALRVWCVNETTAMNPALLDFTDLSHRGLEIGSPAYWVGVASGIRHTVIIPYLLDALRLLFDETKLASTVLPGETKKQITTWVAQLYTHLRTAAHPLQKFHSASSLYGLQYDLQVASMAAFLNDSVAFRYTLGTMQGRLVTMVDAGGHLSVPLGVAQQPYALLSLATWGQALDVAQQLNMTAHLFQFDLTPDRKQELATSNSTGSEGLLCRLVARQIPCCDHPASSKVIAGGGALYEGECVKMLQSATPVDLFIYRRIVRHALPQCPSLEKSWSCASLAAIEIASEKLSAAELSRYQLPPYPFLYK